MSKENAIGLVLVALIFGGLFLLTRRPAPATSYVSSPEYPNNGNIRLVSVEEEPRRYQNKETRRIEYNEDGLPSLIEITRDYAVT